MKWVTWRKGKRKWWRRSYWLTTATRTPMRKIRKQLWLTRKRIRDNWLTQGTTLLTAETPSQATSLQLSSRPPRIHRRTFSSKSSSTLPMNHCWSLSRTRSDLTLSQRRATQTSKRASSPCQRAWSQGQSTTVFLLFLTKETGFLNWLKMSWVLSI